MNRHHLSLAFTCLLFIALIAACAAPPPPAAPPTPTAAPTQPPTEAPAEVQTEAPTSVPTSTSPPQPAPLPGKELIPISSLGNRIPWLPPEDGVAAFSAFYGFNHKRPPFDDVLVRRAFAAAVDKIAVAEAALGFKMREAAPSMTLTPPMILSRDLYGEVGVPYDPAQAKAWLDEAGYTDPLTVPDLTLIVYMRSSAAPGIHYRIAESVADMWRTNLGVEVQIEAVENAPAMITLLRSEARSMYVLGWGADYFDPDNFLKTLFHSGAEFNLGHYSSADYDDLVLKAAYSNDPAERLALYIEAERILTERDVALIPLFHSRGYVP